MERKIAHLISYIFHPLLIPTYATILFILISNKSVSLPFQQALLLLAFILLSTFVFPVLLMLILRNLKVIATLEMKTQRERVLPLVLTALIFYAVFYLLKQGPQGNALNLFLLGTTLLVLLSLLINYFSKISLHMVALGGLFGAITAYVIRFSIHGEWIIILVIFITSLTAYSRLKLEVHSPVEIYSGFILGTGVMMGLFFAV